MPADHASKAADFVRGALGDHRFAAVTWIDETGSTNSDVMAAARDGASEGLVVVAEHQSAGRGRQGRVWVAPPGASLLVSLLLRPPTVVGGLCSMAAGVAMADAVASTTGVRPGLKWPNDLLVEDRKLAGILAEADWPAGSTESGGWRAPQPHERVVIVVGVGLNVNWPADLPDELTETAVALNHLVGHEVDRAELLVAYLRRLDVLYTELVASRSGAAVLDAWRTRSATLGRRVRIDLGSDDVEGTAVDITAEGHLVVETLEADRRVLAVGDVVHVRPARP